jgi:hypothetical protein
MAPCIRHEAVSKDAGPWFSERIGYPSIPGHHSGTITACRPAVSTRHLHTMQLFLLRLGVICVLPSLLILDTLSRLAGLARFQIASCILVEWRMDCTWIFSRVFPLGINGSKPILHNIRSQVAPGDLDNHCSNFLLHSGIDCPEPFFPYDSPHRCSCGQILQQRAPLRSSA